MSISAEEKVCYLREAAIVLAKEGFQLDEVHTGGLRVLLDGAPLCEVTESGGVAYRNEDIDEPERIAAKDKVYEIVSITAEYIITMNTSVPSGCLQIYNDLNHDLYNLLFCAKERPLELVRELGFLPINAHDEFDVLQRQLRGEDFTMEYMERQLDLTEVFFEPPQAEVVRQLLLERGSLGNVRRAAAFYKLQRYSYNGSGDSYGVGSCDIRRFFRDLWECSHRLKDAVLENKDFESIITARNDPQTVVYCDPPYYEAECYTVEFPRSDHQRLHDVLVKHTGFAMVSYNNCPYIRELYDDFFIYEVERPNSQSKKKNNKYREYIMTNYDPRTFAPQMSFFSEYGSGDKTCKLIHIPEKPRKI